MLIRLALILVGLGTLTGLQAQGTAVLLPAPYAPSLSVRNYLALTDEQSRQIQELNQSFREFEAARTPKLAQLNAEIAVETAKQTIDPFSVGTRYVQIEAIQREINAEKSKTYLFVQALLTSVQKAKSQQLQQALADYSTACEALYSNVITPPTASVRSPFFNNLIPESRWFDSSQFLLGRLESIPTGCPQTPLRIPAAVITVPVIQP